MNDIFHALLLKTLPGFAGGQLGESAEKCGYPSAMRLQILFCRSKFHMTAILLQQCR